MNTIKKFGLIFGTCLALVGCGGGQSASSTASSENTGNSAEASGQVVATTTQIDDLFNQIVGDQYEIESLMAVGVDPHGYQASASDVNKLQEADIAAHNGLHLEGKMGDIFAQLVDQGKTTIEMADALDEGDILKTEDGENDPHIWFSVPKWAKIASYVSVQMAEIDPDHAETYASNNEAYQKELKELDTYIRNRVEEVPENSRFLVTAHDAFEYFGEEYGFEVVGLQGISTEAEAGTADVSNLADFIVDHQIKAIFVESSVPSRTIEALQEAVADRGFSVEIGGELYSDSLGDGEASTYVGMYKQNIDTIVDALK